MNAVGVCNPVPVCVPHAVQCVGNSVSTCTGAGVWGVPQACSGLTPVCAAGVCVCANGSHKCVGNAVSTCSANAWSAAVPCGGSTPVCSGGACVLSPACIVILYAYLTVLLSDHVRCANGATQCALGGGIQTCAAGAWGPTTACPLGQSCLAGVCTLSACMHMKLPLTLLVPLFAVHPLLVAASAGTTTNASTILLELDRTTEESLMEAIVMLEFAPAIIRGDH